MAVARPRSNTDDSSPLLSTQSQPVPRQRSTLLPAAIAVTALASLLAGAALFAVGQTGSAPMSRREAGLSSGIAFSASNEAMDVKAGEAVASAVNNFGLSLMKALQSADSADNVFISPTSISSVLAMITLGATGNSSAKQQLMGAWGLEDRDADSFVYGLKQVEAELTSADGVKLLSANSIWCKDSIKEKFTTELSKLGTEVAQLPRSPAPINEWCKKATQGMIPEILSEIPERTVAVVVNAIYFKGSWEKRFEIERTTRGQFQVPASGAKPCAMMLRTDKDMRYAEFKGAQVVELPYKGESVAALIVLPEESKDALGSLSKALDALTSQDGLAEVVGKLAPTKVALRLPRFKMEFGIRDLKPELKETFKMKEVFEGTGAFLEMSADPDVHLSAVLHKAVVEVNEEGTKAAAVTAGIMKARSIVIERPPKEVTVDRPFMFLIRDRATGILLFAGTVTKPELDTDGV